MPLLSTNAQIKIHNSSIQKNLSFESVSSFRDNAEDDHIIPLIGRSFYNLLVDRIADATAHALTSPEIELIRLLTKASANFTIAYYTSFGSVQLSDIGVHVKMSDTQRIASDKKISELKNNSFSNAFKALYQALEFLHLNHTATEFAVYFASAAYDLNTSYFLQYPADAKYVEQIRGNAWLFDGLKGIQLSINETYIIPLISETVLNALKVKIQAQNPSALEKDLIKKIQKAVSFLVMAEGILQNALSLDATGLFSLSENIGGASTGNFQIKGHPVNSEIEEFSETFMEKGKAELENIKVFLNTNIASFTGYTTQIEGALSPMNVNSSDNNFFFS